ncbi:MAG: tetratricopeptide repeat protein [Limnohabitans sp.]
MKQNELIKLAQEADEALKANELDKAEQVAVTLTRYNRSAGLAYKGVVALRREQYDKAEEYLLESFQINAKQHLALANLIPVYIKKRDFKKAVAFGEQAFAAMPKNQSVAINYAAALLQEQGYSKAMEVLKPHYDPEQPNVSVLSGLISCYRSLFMKEEADALLVVAEKHFGDKHEIIRLKADTLAERSPQQALEAFKAALEKDPDNIATRWNMSLVQLRLGEFKDGWINYDNGLLPEVGKIGRPLPKLFEGAQRMVDMDAIDPQKWTFAVCEQGIGDQVLFLGVLRQFLRDYPKTVLIAEKRMAPILKRSFPGLPVYPYGTGPLLAANSEICNGFVPIGSFQKKYRSSQEDFLANRQVYLSPDQEKVAKFRQILLEKTGAKKIVGFSWKGGYWERAQKTKTLDIELWDPIFQRDDVVFVSLQYGEVAKEKAYLGGRFQNIRWIDGLDFKKDLDGWFALACACDDIISVSTALVHFAGAAGRSIHLLLSDRGAPFIWGLEGDRSIAYPDIKIYRKQTSDSPEAFFEGVAAKALK